MKKFDNISISRYIKLLASRSAVPGGGSAAALSGAMGVGLILKAIAFTPHNKNKISLYEKKLRKIFSKLIAAVSRDSEAYLDVVHAMKLPRSNPFEISIRKKKLIRALLRSSQVSREVVLRSEEALKLLNRIGKTLNKNFLSDIECGEHLLKSAALSSEIFLSENKKFARRLQQK